MNSGSLSLSKGEICCKMKCLESVIMNTCIQKTSHSTFYFLNMGPGQVQVRSRSGPSQEGQKLT